MPPSRSRQLLTAGLSFAFALAVPSSGCTSCSKAHGDAFSRFDPEQKLETPGAAPRQPLRYRRPSGQDLVYQLAATREGGAAGPRKGKSSAPRARLRLRVALGFGRGGDPTFRMRLLNVLRLEPAPPQAAPQIGPTHVLLEGTLGPRGALDRLRDSPDLPTPVNLALVAPLLLPAYPQAEVGPGARWRVARRFGWHRNQPADTLLQRAGYHGRTDLLLHRRYHYEKTRQAEDRTLVVLTAKVRGRLRSRTRTLGHRLRSQGRLEGSLEASVDRATGLPEKVTVSLQGRYTLQADDLESKARERLTLELTRER
jgi:hypothetical protein